MRFGVVNTNGDIVTGMQRESTTYMPFKEEPCMFGSAGDSVLMPYQGHEMIFFCYDSQGKIKWTLRSAFATNNDLLGMVAKKNGNVIVAYTAHTVDGFVPVLPAPKELMSNDEFEVEDEPDSDVIDHFARNARFDSEKTNVGYTVVFSEIDVHGVLIGSKAVQGLDDENWSDFKLAPDGGYLIAYEQHLRPKDRRIHPREVNHNFVVKLNAHFEFSWVYKVRFLECGSSGNFYPTSAMTVGPSGDIYILGNAHCGVHLPGAQDHTAPIFPEDTDMTEPYDSYIAKLNSKGELKWVRYTDAKTIISDITADNHNVFVGGSIRLANNFLGIPMDTTGEKKAFIGCLDINGKPKWVQNYRAIQVKIVHADQLGNVFAHFESRSTQYDPPLIIGRDTLLNSYGDLVISSFNSKGEVKWTKSSNAFISRNTDGPVLFSDDCGNLYVVAELHHGLPINMCMLDAAFVRGFSYGTSPLVARIRTTLPADLEELNAPLTAGLTMEPIEIKKENDKPIENKNETGENENGHCIPIPAPWKLEILPNPNNGIFRVRATLSYTDKNLTLEIFDGKGSFSRAISSFPLLEAGTHIFDINLPDLANGHYVVVLRGSSGGVSERLVVAK